MRPRPLSRCARLVVRALRTSRREDDPELQAILLGLQMLAEEPVPSRAELEGRAAELEALNNGLLRLADLSNLLLSCDTSSEAYVVLGRAAREMYGQLSGAVYLYGASRNVVELVTSWGTCRWRRPFRPRTAGPFAAGAPTM